LLSKYYSSLCQELSTVQFNQLGRRKYRISGDFMALAVSAIIISALSFVGRVKTIQFGRSALCGELRCTFTLICNIHLTLLVYNGSGGATGFPHNFIAVFAFFRLIIFYWSAECMPLIAERETVAPAPWKMRVAVTADDRLQIAIVLPQRHIEVS
jgi:hypothetical protein